MPSIEGTARLGESSAGDADFHVLCASEFGFLLSPNGEPATGSDGAIRFDGTEGVTISTDTSDAPFLYAITQYRNINVLGRLTSSLSTGVGVSVMGTPTSPELMRKSKVTMFFTL